jgi:hypothetical protein
MGLWDGDHKWDGARLVGGVLFTSVGTSAPADGDLEAGEVAIWIDETGDTLHFQVKYSDDTTVKSGSIALT